MVRARTRGNNPFRALRLLQASLLAALLLAPTSATAQPATERPEVEYPGPFEATARYRSLTDAAAEAEGEIGRLGTVEDLEAELGDLRQQLDELQALIATLAETEYMRPERIARMRDQALQIEQRLAAVRDRAIERVEVLDALRTEWMERRRFWRGWRQSLGGDPRLPAVAAQFQRALDRIGSVIERIDQDLPEVLQLQQEAAALRAAAERSSETVAEIRAGRHEAMLQRGQPVLLSPSYFEGLTVDALREWRPVAAIRAGAQVAFVRENAPLLLFHLALIVALVLLARHLQGRSIPEGAWSGLLLRPRALAVFSATALLAPRYALAPALGDVVIWSLLAASGAVLATRLVRAGSLRVMVYFFALLYPLFLLGEALAVPPPLFRPLLAAVALAGMALFGILLRREIARPLRNPWTTWLLGLGAAMWFVVLLVEVLGFYLLARWILHATVTTGYIVFVVAFLVVLARGAIGTLVRVEAKGRLSFLRTIGVPVVRQVLRVFQVVLVVVAFLHVLNIWELTPSPAAAWQAITGVGFTFAGLEITLGRVIAAGILLYLAVAFSWVLRTVTRSEVYPRWELERGVGDSINTLLHYFLITLGFFIALGALGVELRNFAIIAGALGVGIGFGLQNIVNNFISGLILLFERPVRVGDTIVLEGELGTIEKIGLRSTIVLTLDQAEVIVPNADLISEKVTNWTLTDPVARQIIPVGVAYGSNVARVLEILRETAARHPDVLADPPPQALFKEFGDSALEFELRVWVHELRLRLHVRSAILAEIDRRFREEDIEIPFPQRDLHLRSVESGLFEEIGAREAGGGEPSSAS